MGKVAENMSQSIGKTLEVAFWTVLFGIYALVYYGVRWVLSQFESEEDKKAKMMRKSLDKEQRRKVVDGILQKQRDIRQEIRTQVTAQLGGEDLNRYFSELSENYITVYVDKVIRSVKIDIE